MTATAVEDGITESLGAGTHADLRRAILRAACLLPSQGPIEVFVHHNTLHAYEHLSFHEAVQAGWGRYEANPYLAESKYREFLAQGRIRVADLEAVLHEQIGEGDDEPIDGLGTRTQIRLAMLQHALHIGPDTELRWVVAETDALDRFRPEVSPRVREHMVNGTRELLAAESNRCGAQQSLVDDLVVKFGGQPASWSTKTWESFTLHLLWRICRQCAAETPPVTTDRTAYRLPRQVLQEATGCDINRYVHDVLIRFCGAFLDQGYAQWTLPDRDRGLFQSFLSLYSERGGVTECWMSGLRGQLLTLRSKQTSPEESIDHSLQVLGVADADREEFLTQTLLSLRGWAGMVWQMETAADGTVRPAPAGSLIEYLAVQLLLELQAIAHVGREEFAVHTSVRDVIAAAAEKLGPRKSLSTERRAFLLFQVSQFMSWEPRVLLQLSRGELAQLTTEIDVFSGLERRRAFHEAYERQYRVAALDAFAIHTRRRAEVARDQTAAERPTFQIACCLDDREESFRRHLEEVNSRCETFGAAGFFSVAMHYKGAADSFYKPLCPAVIDPDHYVLEDVGYTFEGVHRTRTELRSRLGRASYFFHTRSRTFLGGMLAGVAGSLATAPLVARVLFPHLTSRIRSHFGKLLQPPVTQLQLQRYLDPPGADNGHVGFTLEEMADIVTRLMQDIGLTKTEDFSRLFIVCGHGSSSLNNPHESAYCCGACAGKRGGPNARAVSAMANDYRVRSLVAKQGLMIPDDTVFVGAYHDTCDDSVFYFDLDRLPASHRADFEVARKAIDEARQRNAHERCRRFTSAPLTLTPEEALRHVEGRAEDLAQARPEYNHATNALCVVGRRDWHRGLYLDRRAFLTSYDPTQDDEDLSVLSRILAAAIPVCAGINLEYYFSSVDCVKYGSGSKLPHNLISMLGVMEGAASDLRTGLYQQMVEIHEPVRLLFVIETTPAAMLSIMDRHAGIGRLCRGEWVQLALIDPSTSHIQVFRNGEFHPYQPSTNELPEVSSSLAAYAGSRAHLPFQSVTDAARAAPAQTSS